MLEVELRAGAEVRDLGRGEMNPKAMLMIVLLVEGREERREEGEEI